MKLSQCYLIYSTDDIYIKKCTPSKVKKRLSDYLQTDLALRMPQNKWTGLPLPPMKDYMGYALHCKHQETWIKS